MENQTTDELQSTLQEYKTQQEQVRLLLAGKIGPFILAFESFGRLGHLSFTLLLLPGRATPAVRARQSGI